MTSVERPREGILWTLLAGEASTVELAGRLGAPERSTRRRLRRLIEEGYVFESDRGRYRITGFGRRAVDDGAAPPADRAPDDPASTADEGSIGAVPARDADPRVKRLWPPFSR